jgi:hypothetical protein
MYAVLYMYDPASKPWCILGRERDLFELIAKIIYIFLNTFWGQWFFLSLEDKARCRRKTVLDLFWAPLSNTLNEMCAFAEDRMKLCVCEDCN